jgi:hypothetical protein
VAANGGAPAKSSQVASIAPADDRCELLKMLKHLGTVGQTLDSQLEQLRAAGCTTKIYREKADAGIADTAALRVSVARAISTPSKPIAALSTRSLCAPVTHPNPSSPP